MKKVLILFIFCALFVGGCAGKQVAPQKVETDIVSRELSSSRSEVLRNLEMLRDMSKPRPAPTTVADVSAPSEFMTPANFVWDGPLEKGIAALALKIGWGAKKFGAGPVQDIIVQADGSGTVLDVVQNFGAQAGYRANIVADTSSRTFKVVYNNSIPQDKNKQQVKQDKKAKPGSRSVKRQKHEPKKSPVCPEPTVAPKNTSVKLSLPEQKKETPAPQTVKPAVSTPVSVPVAAPTVKKDNSLGSAFEGSF